MVPYDHSAREGTVHARVSIFSADVSVTQLANFNLNLKLTLDLQVEVEAWTSWVGITAVANIYFVTYHTVVAY